ncbi:hypothetical protein V6Z12_D03G118600 [Gossypium hirsutum]
MALVNNASKTAESSHIGVSQPKTFINSVVATMYSNNILKRPFLVVREFDAHMNSFDSPFIYDLCVEGTQWIVSSQECYTVEKASLKSIGKVWYHFLKSRLMPSTHNTTVSNERILLLHSIIKGRTINVGRIIFQEVHHCVKKDAGSLNFPSLITTLCKTANVPLTDAEDITPNKGGLTRATFVKLRGIDTASTTQQSQASTAMRVPTATPWNNGNVQVYTTATSNKVIMNPFLPNILLSEKNL